MEELWKPAVLSEVSKTLTVVSIVPLLTCQMWIHISTLVTCTMITSMLPADKNGEGHAQVNKSTMAKRDKEMKGIYKRARLAHVI